VSLFSGGGFSDLGYEKAGFSFVVHAELYKSRATLCQKNFAGSSVVVGNLRQTWPEVVRQYRNVKGDVAPALVSITPPCQGMSSSNPGRGKITDAGSSDERNSLILVTVPLLRQLRPRTVVVENVPQVLRRVVHVEGHQEPMRVFDAFVGGLGEDYEVFGAVVRMADYGIPQDRRRAIIVALRKDDQCLEGLTNKGRYPFPVPTHSRTSSDGLLPWVTVQEWFKRLNYPPLEASSADNARDERDPLHFVPWYEKDRYEMVAEIPPRSGKSAYQNSKCPECGRADVPEGVARCPSCGGLMRNRPYIADEKGDYRLVKGFKSSYRRMHPDRPAPPVMTASDRLGSDYKIHPWENRLLSVRECADLQTIPRYYDWSWALENGHRQMMREVIGEAIPTWFTYLHGTVLRHLLDGDFEACNLIRVSGERASP
jgi:DNA (cytosine-5)-methyltransferase 1